MLPTAIFRRPLSFFSLYGELNSSLYVLRRYDIILSCIPIAWRFNLVPSLLGIIDHCFPSKNDKQEVSNVHGHG